MLDPTTARTLERAHALAAEYLAGVADRPVAGPVEAAALRAALGGPLPEGGTDAAAVVEARAAG